MKLHLVTDGKMFALRNDDGGYFHPGARTFYDYSLMIQEYEFFWMKEADARLLFKRFCNPDPILIIETGTMKLQESQ